MAGTLSSPSFEHVKDVTGQSSIKESRSKLKGGIANMAEAKPNLVNGDEAGEATPVIAEEQTTQIKETLVPKSNVPRRPNPRQQLNKLYALPAPLRTFPLPTFVPHNPLSLLHILYSWISQTIYPPSSHFETLYQGYWSPATRSIHITDERCIRGLWEQGFYGKGSLSRSEPNWLAKEKTRRGSKGKTTSEELTQQRRAERQQTKWERARKEREAIERKRFEEAEAVRTSSEILSSQESALNSGDTSFTEYEDDITIDCLKLPPAPVGPIQLFALPNSSIDLYEYQHSDTSLTDDEEEVKTEYLRLPPAPVGPIQLLALPNSTVDLYEYQHSTPGAELDDWQTMPIQTLADEVLAVVQSLSQSKEQGPITPEDQSEGNSNAHDQNTGYSLIATSQADRNATNTTLSNGHTMVADAKHSQSFIDVDAVSNGSSLLNDTLQPRGHTPNGSALASGSPQHIRMKRQKSVRFSPTVEKTTFIQSDPPSPDRVITPPIEKKATLDSIGDLKDLVVVEAEEDQPLAIKNKEHFQLTTEEAFFLSYALGALTIYDPTTRGPIPNNKLLELFRQSSSFPPLATPSVSPDDTFMLNYVVYHHFRSLGWVVRGGSKFSVDYMLYKRGPVFTHAEFAVLILPSYTDEYWSRDAFLENYARNKEKRTWAWFHCINRVITQVKKTLVLVYVDIPAPCDGEAELPLHEVFGRYKVREFCVKRWSPNRQRGEGPAK